MDESREEWSLSQQWTKLPRASHPVRPPPLRNRNKLRYQLNHEGDALAKLAMNVENEKQDVMADSHVSPVPRPVAVSSSYR